MTDYIKIYSGSEIEVKHMQYLLDQKAIASLIKNEVESGRLAGFGTSYNAVDLYVFKKDETAAITVIKGFQKESNI